MSSLSHVLIWNAFHESQVYDLTSYLDEHPGGDDIVIAATGT